MKNLFALSLVFTAVTVSASVLSQTPVPATAPVEATPTPAPTTAPVEAAPAPAPTAAPVEAAPAPAPTAAPVEATPAPAPTTATLPTTDLSATAPAPVTSSAEQTSDSQAAATPAAIPPVQEPPQRSLFVLTWNMATSLGNSRDFIEDFSFSGVGFGYQFHIRPVFSIGLLFAWQTFETKFKGTETYDDGLFTITGTQIRSRDFMPLVATAHYNFIVGKGVAIPFVGIETGAYRVGTIIDHGWFNVSDSQWHYGFAPEVGLRFEKIKLPFYFSVKYNYLVPNSEEDSQMYLSYHIGISWSR